MPIRAAERLACDSIVGMSGGNAESARREFSEIAATAATSQAELASEPWRDAGTTVSAIAA